MGEGQHSMRFVFKMAAKLSGRRNPTPGCAFAVAAPYELPRQERILKT